ncbi:MAG: hypothetical protein ACKVP2_06830 [Burkholderiales bacterium]
MAKLDLLTETGALLGFLLFAGPGEFDASMPRRDCTLERFRPSIGHELGDVISFAQGKPYRCNTQAVDGNILIRAHIHEGMSIVIERRPDGSCQWYVEKLFGRSAKNGQCKMHGEGA